MSKLIKVRTEGNSLAFVPVSEITWFREDDDGTNTLLWLRGEAEAILVLNPVEDVVKQYERCFMPQYANTPVSLENSPWEETLASVGSCVNKATVALMVSSAQANINMVRMSPSYDPAKDADDEYFKFWGDIVDKLESAEAVSLDEDDGVLVDGTPLGVYWKDGHLDV